MHSEKSRPLRISIGADHGIGAAFAQGNGWSEDLVLGIHEQEGRSPLVI